jgi:serine/threonine protein kinase
MLHWPRMVDAGGAPIDRYVVLEHLSEGGMGAIYVGKKLGAGGFEMEVVLKQLLPEFTQQEEFIDLFLREAKLSATLDHANIVHTIDLVTAGGEYFIVMEYLPGGDLRTLVKKAKRRGKRFSPAAAIRVGREILSALAYAHVKRDLDGQPLKLIHRDVSPSNILISYTGEVKLTDFGIAKASTHNSLFYKVKGKIGYMSPEQAKSESLDHRSDLYSLAVCMYEVITGERLFVHAGLTTSAEEIYSQPVPSLVKKVGVPADLDAVMKKALSIDPDDRFQTAGEFNEALTRCAHRHGLLIAAPELSRELLEACGPTDQWRGEDDDDDLGYAEHKRAGTEILDSVGDDEDDDDDDDDLGIGPVSIHSIAMARTKSKSGSDRPSRPMTEINKFAGVELTSIINMMDIEGSPGSRPLVNLDSGPQAMPITPTPEPAREFTLRGQGPVHTKIGQGAPRSRPSNSQPPPPFSPPSAPSLPLPPPPPSVADPRELMPTAPRGHRVMPAPEARAPAPQPRAQPQSQPQPSKPKVLQPQRPPTPVPKGKKSGFQPWMVILLLLVAGGIAAGVVALSGPDVGVEDK